MNEEQRLLQQLLAELHSLKQRQAGFEKEILMLQNRIFELSARLRPVGETSAKPVQSPALEQVAIPAATISKPEDQPEMLNKPGKKMPQAGWENYVGQQLISRAGILITIIGIAIGVKYSIEHQILSPFYRMILGYLLAGGMFFLAVRLKKKYLTYSAVLISGSFATAYVISFAAFSFYHFFPASIAFLIMLLITAGTVATAIWYGQQVIAIIGLVGAYAIPFLVNSGSENYTGFFSYISLINLGIVFISFLRYWKTLLYSAFIASWLIFSSWYFFEAKSSDNIIALSFLIILFLSFYIAFLAYHLRRKQLLPVENVAIVLSNLLLFYSLGFSIIDAMTQGQLWLFIFSILISALQAIACWIVYKMRSVDRPLLLLLGGLALVFATVSIPVILDADWVTILWSGEALFLFVAAIKFDHRSYARLGICLLFLATLSLLQDWTNRYAIGYGIDALPFLNVGFFNTVFYSFVLAFMNRSLLLNQKSYVEGAQRWQGMYQYLLPAMLIFFVYLGIALEINYFWYYRLTDISRPQSLYRESIPFRTSTWIFIFSGIYLWVIGYINKRFIKSEELSIFSFVAILLAALAFTTVVLPEQYKLDELYRRNGHLSITDYLVYHGFTYSVVVLMIAALQQLSFLAGSIKQVIRFVVIHFLLLCILSAEISFWFRQFGLIEAIAVSLSICWGLYAAGMIVRGLKKDQRNMRIAGIVLLGITLVKLFFNDLSKVNTLAKTVIFLSLGVLLLTVSFLYNKQLARTAKLSVEE